MFIERVREPVWMLFNVYRCYLMYIVVIINITLAPYFSFSSCLVLLPILTNSYTTNSIYYMV